MKLPLYTCYGTVNSTDWLLKLYSLIDQSNVFTDKREVKMLRIIEPKDKKKDFIAGPAQFGPDLGGETQYQVQ